MSRPTKLNAETQKQIIAALSIGCTRKDSAESAGVSYASFILWMHTGETKTRGNFYKFFKAVVQAEALARRNYVNTIALAANAGDWRAAETFLKRRDPENWGDKVKQENSGEVKIIVEYVDSTDSKSASSAADDQSEG